MWLRAVWCSCVRQDIAVLEEPSFRSIHAAAGRVTRTQQNDSANYGSDAPDHLVWASTSRTEKRATANKTQRDS